MKELLALSIIAKNLVRQSSVLNVEDIQVTKTVHGLKLNVKRRSNQLIEIARKAEMPDNGTVDKERPVPTLEIVASKLQLKGTKETIKGV